jgi:hypothetical protein
MQSDLENLSLQELSDMLINKTKELMQLSGIKNADGFAIRSLHIEVEKIREAIKAHQNSRMHNSIQGN